MKRVIFAMVLPTFSAPGVAFGQSTEVGPETGAPLPRFESLRFNKVNLRRGAGEDYPIAWTFQLYGLPVQIFQDARTVLIQDEIADVHAEPDAASKIVARVEPGVVMTLLACQVDWCRAKAQGYRGWIKKAGQWGVLPEDAFGDD